MADYPRASATLEAKPTFVKPLPEPGVSIDGDWAQQLTEAGNYMLAHTWVRSFVVVRERVAKRKAKGSVMTS